MELDLLNCLLLGIGSAIKDVKRLKLSVQWSINMDQVGIAEKFDTFFAFLQQMKAIRYFEIVIGSVSALFYWNLQISDENFTFWERLMKFVKSKDDLEFRWCAGAHTMRDSWAKGAAGTNRKVVKLLGKENELPYVRGA